MANPETVINSIRQRCTEVFEACQEHLGPVEQDRADFISEKTAAFFTTWFAGIQNYDITLLDLVAAVTAMQTLKTTFDQVRSKLQIVRTR